MYLSMDAALADAQAGLRALKLQQGIVDDE